MTIALLHLRLDAQYEALEYGGTFTAVLPAGGRSWGQRRPTLLLSDGEIVELGHVRAEGKRIATGMRRMRYERFLALDPEIPVAEVVSNLSSAIRRHFEARLGEDLVLPERTGAAVLEALESLSDEVAEVSTDFVRPVVRRVRRLDGAALQATAQEADAVRLALDIAGIPRQELHGTRPDGETPYVQALSEVRVFEDQAIDYDAGRFLDFERIERPNGMVHFSRGAERLTVLNVNRRPLERLTGADLIYHNETHDSFVLVQYKTMTREGDLGDTRLVYRPDSDRNLPGELERMRALAEVPGDGSAEQWRLNPGFCFIKLCRPVVNLDFPERELVGGMYLPLSYWDLLVASPVTEGPQGGRVLSYETVTRRFDNSLFVQLVRGSWLGSRAETTETITDLVLQGLDANRSVTVASAWSVAPPHEEVARGQ